MGSRSFKTVFFGLVVTARAAFGWGDVGHSTVAEIAERFLDPATKQFLQSILGPEPLAVAAVWPDQVRSDARFKGFAPYHFVEIVSGTQYKAGAPKNGHTMLSQVPALLKSASVSADRKRILLRYFIHVMGDVHQPLHVGNGIDMGANLCEVRWIEPESYGKRHRTVRDLNLHTVWDENLIDVMKEEFRAREDAARRAKGLPPQKRWFGYFEFADWITGEAKAKYSQSDLEAFVKGDLLDWYAESRGLHNRVYPEKSFEPDPFKRKYCKVKNPANGKIENGAYDAKSIPTLDKAYADDKTALIRLQILKGGLRLAQKLKQIAAGETVTVENEADLIRSLLLVNPDAGHQAEGAAE